MLTKLVDLLRRRQEVEILEEDPPKRKPKYYSHDTTGLEEGVYSLVWEFMPERRSVLGTGRYFAVSTHTDGMAVVDALMRENRSTYRREDNRVFMGEPLSTLTPEEILRPFGFNKDKYDNYDGALWYQGELDLVVE